MEFFEPSDYLNNLDTSAEEASLNAPPQMDGSLDLDHVPTEDHGGENSSVRKDEKSLTKPIPPYKPT